MKKEGVSRSEKYGKRQLFGLIGGALSFGLVLFLPLGIKNPEAQKALSVTVLMAVWWITEALPISVVSLVPIALFPALGIMDSTKVTLQYAHHIVFLFMSGFLIAMAMQKWELHRRIALHIINLIGTGPKKIVLGFMFASAFLSMWVSNTATSMMMVTIALAILSYIGTISDGDGTTWEESKFGKTLLLGIAYACSIGGIGTLIGTPPNALLAGFMESQFGTTITFLEWIIVGFPVVLILTPVAWFYLTRVSSPIKRETIPGGRELIDQKLEEIGPMGRGEKSVLVVFAITAFLWITRSFIITPFFPMIGDATIGIFASISLFIIPIEVEEGEFALDWEWALKIPWGTLILVGGGLALAEGIEVTGLANWLAGALTWLGGAPMILVLLGTILLMVSLTHVTSNTATTAMMLPVLATFATNFGFDFLSIAIPTVISVSCAFMLPVATPPNAVVFGTGYITVPDMVKNGFGLNVLSVILVTMIGYFLLEPLMVIIF